MERSNVRITNKTDSACEVLKVLHKNRHVFI